MRQEQRVILALVLSTLIFIGYYKFLAPPPLAMNTAQESQVQKNQSSSSNVALTVPIQAVQPVDEMETKAQVKDIVIETSKSRIVLSTKGAVLTGYELKNYRVSAEKNAPLRDLIKSEPDSYALFLGLKGYEKITAQTVFDVVSDQKNVDGSRSLVLAWQDKNLRLEKQFLFGSPVSDYQVLVSYRILNQSGQTIRVIPYFSTQMHQKPLEAATGLSRFFHKPQDQFGYDYFQEKSLHSFAQWEKMNEPIMANGKIFWSGVSDRYFLLSLNPDQSLSINAQVFAERQGDFLVAKLYHPQVDVLPQEKNEGNFSAYVGPKELDELKKVAVNLDKAVDYGIFSILAIPILYLMTYLHMLIPNWGVVIIALTFIIKILLHPVNKKSFTSMKAMQQLQPKLQEIKKKYPDDKDKQNVEVMQLFRTHKVNPAAGCLPMLLQMPVYIVLYKVLWNAIELYHAPFFGFYKDLSAPDPYFIAPVLLGISMFLQQKFTPNPSADPAQKNMMMIMPLMFSVFMIFLPVGLVVYIFVNTLTSAIQQFIMTRNLTLKDFLTGNWKEKPV